MSLLRRVQDHRGRILPDDFCVHVQGPIRNASVQRADAKSHMESRRVNKNGEKYGEGSSDTSHVIAVWGHIYIRDSVLQCRNPTVSRYLMT